MKITILHLFITLFFVLHTQGAVAVFGGYVQGSQEPTSNTWVRPTATWSATGSTWTTTSGEYTGVWRNNNATNLAGWVLGTGHGASAVNANWNAANGAFGSTVGIYQNDSYANSPLASRRTINYYFGSAASPTAAGSTVYAGFAHMNVADPYIFNFYNAAGSLITSSVTFDAKDIFDADGGPTNYAWNSGTGQITHPGVGPADALLQFTIPSTVARIEMTFSQNTNTERFMMMVSDMALLTPEPARAVFCFLMTLPFVLRRQRCKRNN